MAVDLAQTACKNPSPQDTWALRRVFKEIGAESCPTVYNFHMHTTCSDGRLHPEALMMQALNIGLAGFAITDHHTVNGYRLAQNWLNNWRQRSPENACLPHLWVGVEVTSLLQDVEVHILGYGFEPESPLMIPYLQGNSPVGANAQAEQVIAAIHGAGGLAVLAHPVRYRRSPEDLIAAAAACGIDGVETYYAYDNPTPWRTSPAQTQRVEQLSAAYNLLNTCGTDTHGPSLLQRL
jgi:predicted metal-dependent phosphoesterase TrpH